MNFWEIVGQYWGVAAFTFVLGVALVLLALWLFPKIGLMDRPLKYGLSRKPIPYYGGLAIFFTFLIAVLLFVPLSQSVVGLLVGASLLVFVGFLDDYFDVSPLVRLIVQFVAAFVLVVSGVGILSINIPFLGTLVLDTAFLSGAFTILWVMALINTMNFVDGISGLNSGVSFIAGVTLFLLSINPVIHENPQSQVSVAILALIVAMAALAFLIFDFPKPKILMGDTGSTFFGFVLAALAIFSGGKVATAFLVLGLPILDMVWAILRRVIEGRKIWHGDLKHLHHRLLDFGLSRRQVVSFYLLITALFGFSAVTFVSSEQKFFMLIALVVLMLLLISALVFVPNKNK